MKVILVTGARELRDRAKAEELARSLLSDAVGSVGVDNLLVMHGDAPGIDTIFRTVCEQSGIKHEPWPAAVFNHPFARNRFMCNTVASMKAQGWDAECWAFARKWASGTGNCSREARRQGIKTIDYGVSTEDPNSPF